MSDKRTDDYVKAAYQLGADAAKAAASYTVELCQSGGGDEGRPMVRPDVVLKMLTNDDMDAARDYLPNEPDLSGEMADAPTPTSIAREIVADWDDMAPEQAGELSQWLADAWEEGVSDNFTAFCEAELKAHIGANEQVNPLGERANNPNDRAYRGPR